MYCSSLNLFKSCSTSECWSGFIPFITVFALFMSITSIIWELLPSSICLLTSPNRACSFSGVAVLLSALGGLLALSGEYLPDLFYSAAAIYSLHLSLYFYLSSLSWSTLAFCAFIWSCSFTTRSLYFLITCLATDRWLSKTLTLSYR